MFSESRNDRRRRIGDRTAADRLRDRDNATGTGDNSAEIGDYSAEIGDSSAEIDDDTAGMVDISANVIPSQTPPWMETGVTLFLEDKFQRGPPPVHHPYDAGLMLIMFVHLQVQIISIGSAVSVIGLLWEKELTSERYVSLRETYLSVWS